MVIATNGSSSGLAFQLAPDHQRPQWPDPARPQQFHLDVMVDDLAAAEPQVLAWVPARLSANVYEDPAGHPFCIIPTTRLGAAGPAQLIAEVRADAGEDAADDLDCT